MKFVVKFTDTDVVPPVAWRQYSKAIHEIGKQYGFHVEISVDWSNQLEADQRYFDWVAKQQGDGG